MKITVTNETAANEKDFYAQIIDRLGYIGHFGNNLDALYDVLTESREPFEIIIDDPDFALRYGGRGNAILAVMRAAEEANKCFGLTVITDDCL